MVGVVTRRRAVRRANIGVRSRLGVRTDAYIAYQVAGVGGSSITSAAELWCRRLGGR